MAVGGNAQNIQMNKKQ